MERPEGVPATAKYDKKAGYWYDGNAKSPVQRLWTTDGDLMLEAPRRNGKLHGELKWSPAIDNQKQYASRVAIAKELGLAGGPTDTQIATYKDGTLVSVRFRPGLGDWYDDELVATLEDGKLAKLEWTIAGIGDGDLFSLGSTVIRDDDFKLPKPWPHKLVATFVDGKLASHAFFNEKGKPVAGDRPLAEWGANTKPAKLRGYVERGDFVADAKKFFPKMEKLAAKLPKKLDKLAQLPAAKAIEAALRKKQLPEMGIVLDMSDFGPDCKQLELDGLADPAYVVVGSDGSGDMYLLDTRTGKVHIYRHEESKLDKKAFDSLDTFAFAALRAEAAMRDMIPKAALKKTFKALGIDAGAALLPY
ncbi:SMI1/KNR4 family protein [Nannocystis sp. SCPEA4]|uniref:SMI1/KNR4 family protein n=1 Tax=Nannocystis sp. SCPEA4 TaxID=2996787 RepID=UPI0022711346|nr:SMI1/KNR4 family protein [Nannocystis sp. SCPEA4]MCY1058211.1 SMI1/KNR4 family protein [Nannocystis sp. SCPEA4]